MSWCKFGMSTPINRKKQYGAEYLAEETIKFPFIVLSTENTPENAVSSYLRG